MRAYVTLLSTMNYLPGVLGLQEALRRVGSGYGLVVGLSQTLPMSVDTLLQERGIRTIRLPSEIDIPQHLKEKSGHWAFTFDKLHLFGLTQFRKLVYIDSDMLILSNLDELFEKPHMSAVAAGSLVHADWNRLNSGLMVIEPEPLLPQKIAGTLEKALDELAGIGQTRVGDQDLINAYYGDWPEATHLHLDAGYNVFHIHTDAYIEKHHYCMPHVSRKGDRLIKVVHFIGGNKPWMPWAGLKHRIHALRTRSAARWENEAFGIYRKLLSKATVRGAGDLKLIGL